MNGSQGCKGDKGDKGATGVQGAQGATGARGPGGQNGSKGAQGAQGDKGNKGNTGAQGLQGLLGRTGCIGRQGNTGAQGLPGNMGYPGYQGIRGPPGYKGSQGDGSLMTFGTNSTTNKFTGNNNIYFDPNSFIVEEIPDSSAILISSTNTSSSGPSYSKLTSAPPTINFDTSINITSSKIYISWTYPLQSTAGFIDAYIPFINTFEAYYSINDISHNIVDNLSGNNYIKEPPSYTGTPLYITGIIFTNVASDILGYQQNQQGFSTDPTSRNALVVYAPSIISTSNTLYARYNNYNPESENFAFISFPKYTAAGIPSAPYIGSTATYDATYGSNNIVKITITAGSGTYTDIGPPGTSNVYAINEYDFSYNSLGSDYRYIKLTTGALNYIKILSEPNNSHIDIPISYCIPDASYNFDVTCRNNSSNQNDSAVSSCVYRTPALSAPPMPTTSTSYISSFTDTSTSVEPSHYSGKLVGSNSSNDSLNGSYTVYNTPSSNKWISNQFHGIPIHASNNRGYGIDTSSKYGKDTNGSNAILDISCNIVRGSYTSGGVTISYKGFHATNPSDISSNGITISTSTPPTDYYDGLSYIDGCKYFYLITGHNQVSINNNATSIFTNTNDKTNVNLYVQQRNIDGSPNGSMITTTSFPFYYDNLYNTSTPFPSFTSFDANLNAAPSNFTQISGIWILYGDISLTATTIVNNIGNFFYNPTQILTYSTGDKEADLTHTTSISGKQLLSQVTFVNPNIICKASNTFLKSINVYADKVYNCVGNSSSATSTTKQFNIICDKPSYDLINNSGTYPTYPSTILYIGEGIAAGVYGYRIKTISSSNNAIPDLQNSVLTSGSPTKYIQSWNISDTDHNEELQICNGAYRTYTSANGNGYLNYNGTYFNAALTTSQIDLTTNLATGNSDYRYATFAWKCKNSFHNYFNAQFNVNGVVSDMDISGVRMFYRVEDASSPTISAANNNTIWINANGIDNVINQGNYYNTSYTSLGGKNTALTTNSTTFNYPTPSIYTINVLIPGLVISTDNTYIYFRIGFPMSNSVSFTNVTAILSYPS